MKKICHFLLILMVYCSLAYSDDKYYPVDPDTYKDLVDLQRSIADDSRNLLDFNKTTSGEKHDSLTIIANHFMAIDTELSTFITLLPLESYHELGKLLGESDFAGDSHNIPALEYIRVQCSLSDKFFKKKLVFTGKQLKITDDKVVLSYLGKLEKYLKDIVDVLTSFNSRLDLLLNAEK